MRAIVAIVGLVLLATVGASQEPGSVSSASLEAKVGNLPVCFIENRGVHAGDAAFYVEGRDRTLLFGSGGISIAVRTGGRVVTFQLRFVGSRPGVVPRGEDRRATVVSYFVGPSASWKTGLSTYGKVVYPELWPGIDLVYRAEINRLKYSFVVRPGADPSQIRLAYVGADVSVAMDGALEVDRDGERISDPRPTAIQDIGGAERSVVVSYVSDDTMTGTFGFQIGDYDRTRRLVIDPVLVVRCGFLGIGVGTLSDLALDASGNAYIAGSTPFLVGAFVAKVDPSGQRLLFYGVIGGVWPITGSAVAVDKSGGMILAGSISNLSQSKFPVKNGPRVTPLGNQDCFITKVNAAGTNLVYSGFLGGPEDDAARDLAVDSSESAWIAGYYKTAPAVEEVYLARIATDGRLQQEIRLPGGYADGIVLGPKGNLFVIGTASSTTIKLPTKVGPNLNPSGGRDAFVAKLSPAGSVTYCGYVGGKNYDVGSGIAVDASGAAYLGGYTSSDETSFPVRTGPSLSYSGGGDAFVAKVSPSGAQLEWAGYIGGAGQDSAVALALAPNNDVLVAGFTESNELTFPVQDGPDLTHNLRRRDGFVARVAGDGSKLRYCGYLGGERTDRLEGAAVDAAGDFLVVGSTWSDEQSLPVAGAVSLYRSQLQEEVFLATISDRFPEPPLGPSGTATLRLLKGSATIGDILFLLLQSPQDAGLQYQCAASFRPGPTRIGNRSIPLELDRLFLLSVGFREPDVFGNFASRLNGLGNARVDVLIPRASALRGMDFHLAYLVLHANAPYGVKTISNGLSFRIQ